MELRNTSSWLVVRIHWHRVFHCLLVVHSCYQEERKGAQEQARRRKGTVRIPPLVAPVHGTVPTYWSDRFCVDIYRTTTAMDCLHDIRCSGRYCKLCHLHGHNRLYVGLVNSSTYTLKLILKLGSALTDLTLPPQLAATGGHVTSSRVSSPSPQRPSSRTSPPRRTPIIWPMPPRSSSAYPSCSSWPCT